MILKRYDYKYALVPYEVARALGLGWRKVTSENKVLLNQTELRGLEGDTFEEQVEKVGGTVLTAEDARYYARTTTFSVYVSPPPEPEPPLPENPDTDTDRPVTLPSFPDEEFDNPVTLPSFPDNDVELLNE